MSEQVLCSSCQGELLTPAAPDGAVVYELRRRIFVAEPNGIEELPPDSARLYHPDCLQVVENFDGYVIANREGAGMGSLVMGSFARRQDALALWTYIAKRRAGAEFRVYGVSAIEPAHLASLDRERSVEVAAKTTVNLSPRSPGAAGQARHDKTEPFHPPH